MGIEDQNNILLSYFSLLSLSPSLVLLSNSFFLSSSLSQFYQLGLFLTIGVGAGFVRA